MMFSGHKGYADFILCCADGPLFLVKHIATKLPGFKAYIEFSEREGNNGVVIYDASGDGLTKQGAELIVSWLLDNGHPSPGEYAIARKTNFESFSAKSVWNALDFAHMVGPESLEEFLDGLLCKKLRRSPSAATAEMVNGCILKGFSHTLEWIMANKKRINLAGVTPDIIRDTDSARILGAYIKANNVAPELFIELANRVKIDQFELLDLLDLLNCTLEERARIFVSMPC